MKSKLFHLVTVCLVAILTVILFVQTPASAIGGDEERGGHGVDPRIIDFTPGRPGLVEVGIETVKPSVANPKGTQPRPGQSLESFLNEQRSKEFDKATGGRDVSRDNAAGESMERSRKEGKSAA
ncbi:hypothetical protein [Leptolyngbya ohadii]|uniref:hypothetical protein n=1 Tax=Leptolyngbya ohadii TaxID=1962290 RepID=UPI000B59B76B|nr:hypothetical protein [Leptolyngbya ohadii]